MTQYVAQYHCVDGGNNTGWIFAGPPVFISLTGYMLDTKAATGYYISEVTATGKEP